MIEMAIWLLNETMKSTLFSQMQKIIKYETLSHSTLYIFFQNDYAFSRRFNNMRILCFKKM